MVYIGVNMSLFVFRVFELKDVGDAADFFIIMINIFVELNLIPNDFWELKGCNW